MVYSHTKNAHLEPPTASHKCQTPPTTSVTCSAVAPAHPWEMISIGIHRSPSGMCGSGRLGRLCPSCHLLPPPLHHPPPLLPPPLPPPPLASEPSTARPLPPSPPRDPAALCQLGADACRRPRGGTPLSGKGTFPGASRGRRVRPIRRAPRRAAAWQGARCCGSCPPGEASRTRGQAPGRRQSRPPSRPAQRCSDSARRSC
mmetsp:Transcript_68096/g.156602  ORF Transcript_68096/g.156602 Transcript_68096/m.156602 type:complete len:201 (-) Transcript_68096:122-724(-)